MVKFSISPFQSNLVVSSGTSPNPFPARLFALVGARGSLLASCGETFVEVAANPGETALDAPLDPAPTFKRNEMAASHAVLLIHEHIAEKTGGIFELRQVPRFRLPGSFDP
jgi:hypothetical protein